MTARQAEDTLDQPNRADAARGQGRVGPFAHDRPDPRTLAEQAIDKGLLSRGGLGLAGARREGPRRHEAVHGDQRVVRKDADQMRVPLHADVLAQQRERDGVKRAIDLDVAIGVDRALAGTKERKCGRRERLEGALLGLDEMGPDLSAGRAMDLEPCDGPIPVPQMRIVRVEVSKRRPFSALLLT
jgi:hypothetical protein